MLQQATYPHHAQAHHHRLQHHQHRQQQQQQQQHQQQQHHVYAPQLAYHDPLLLAPGYQPLHLPLQPPQQTQQHHHQAAEQQQLALAQQQAAAAGFHAPHSRLHHQHPPIPHRSRHAQLQQPRHQLPTMAYQASDDELAELQKLSANYQPEITGPLVSQRQPSSAITTEYATADPVYQAKTAALPHKYSHYRTVRGDGRCGWRAVAFGYLERLLSIGDTNRFYEEEARLRSLSNVLNAAGFEPYLYEDFADEMLDLMRRLAGAVGEGNGDEALLEAFNDENLQNCIITHVKTLTAAWMKTHPENYAGYMMGQTVDQYCTEQILPVGSEIDHIGLSALKDVLLCPAFIALEVMYLDRSAGEEVNLHRFEPIGGYTAATMRLLYRPGHYDLLYKLEDVPPPPTPVSTYLQFGASQPYHEPVGDFGGVPDFMTMIPGMSFANSNQGWMSGSSYGSDFFAAPAPVQPCAQIVPTPAVPAPQPQIQPQISTEPMYASATPAPLAPPPTQMPQDLALRPASHTSHVHPSLQHQLGGPFRPSHWELKPDFVQQTSHAPFQTSIFKQSHFNTAHFQNENFQPEEWRPDDEYVTTSSKSSSRHKNSG